MAAFAALALVVCTSDDPESSAGETTTTGGEVGCAAQVFGGVAHDCAIRADRTLWCWGANDFGQLGDGSISQDTVEVPVQALGLADVVLASPSSATTRGFTCATRADGRAWCWGTGPIGVADTVVSTTPLEVVTLSNVVSISGGDEAMCAALASGEVYCWGRDVLGEYRFEPMLVDGIGGPAAEVASGRDFDCALRVDGVVACWGSTEFEVLGSGLFSNHEPPRELLAGAVDLAVSRAHTIGQTICARLTDGSLVCWGRGIEGQFGDGLSHNSGTPVTVEGLPPNIVEIGVGGTHVCIRTEGGEVWCWGGSLSTPALPELQEGLGEIVSLGVGNVHACVVDTKGVIRCFLPNSDEEPWAVELPCE